jgi:outer membrane protein assembly factor BamB
MVRTAILTLLAGVLVCSLSSPTAARKPPPDAVPLHPERIEIDVTGSPKLDHAPVRGRLRAIRFEYRERKGFVVRITRKQTPSNAGMPKTLPSPTVAEGVAIVSGGIADSLLIGIEAKTGRQLWTTTLGDNGPSTLAVGRFRNRTRASVNTQSCTTYTLDPRTGKLEWRRTVGPSVLAAPAISGDRVYAAHTVNTASKNGLSAAISALDLVTGKVVWSTPIPSDITGAPVVADGRIYLTEMTGTVSCFDLEGKAIWRAPLRALNAPVHDAAGLFVAVRDIGATGIVRLDPKNGKAKWTFRPTGPSAAFRTVTEGQPRTPTPQTWTGWAADPPRPVVLGSSLVVAGYRDLSILDTFTGKEKTRMVLPAGRTFSSPPAVTGGTLLYGTAEGLLLEIDPNLRAVRRVLDLGAKIHSQPVVCDGMVYVMAGDCLYGIPWFKPGGPSYAQWGGG